MKQVLRSFLTLVVVGAVVVGSTSAYFTSSVSAEDNEIVTGTLRLVLHSAQDGQAYRVAYDDPTGEYAGLNTAPFPVLSNMTPGVEQYIYVSVSNWGTIPLNYRAMALGNWVDEDLDDSSNNALMEVTEVRRLRPGSTTCSNSADCAALQGRLTNLNRTQVGGNHTLPGPVWGWFGDGYHGLSRSLGADEFSIYRVGITLSTDAGNEYQGQEYNYLLMVDGKQTNAPHWDE